MPGRAHSPMAPETIESWGGWAIEAKPFDRRCRMIVAQVGHWAIDLPAIPRTQPFMAPVTAHDEIPGNISGCRAHPSRRVSERMAFCPGARSAQRPRGRDAYGSEARPGAGIRLHCGK